MKNLKILFRIVFSVILIIGIFGFLYYFIINFFEGFWYFFKFGFFGFMWGLCVLLLFWMNGKDE